MGLNPRVEVRLAQAALLKDNKNNNKKPKTQTSADDPDNHPVLRTWAQHCTQIWLKNAIL